MPTAPHPSPALSKALSQIDRAFGGKPAPAASAPRPAVYKPPVYRPSVPVNERTRKTNLAKMAKWVEGQRRFAVDKADPEAFLQERHDWLGRMMSSLGAGCPMHLRGLDANDLSLAQIDLIGPLARREEAAQARRVAA